VRAAVGSHLPLIVAAAVALALVPEPTFDDREHTATLDKLARAALTLQEGLEASGAALPAGRVIPLPDLGARLGKRYAKKLSARDGWGRPLYAVQTSRHLVAGSAGADGSIAVDPGALDAPGAIVHDILPSEADDLVWIDGIVVANDLDVEQARRRRTAWRLAHISQWIDLSYVSGGPYPGAGRGAMDIADLEGLLAAAGRGTHLPRRDAWGRVIAYVSDGTRYVLRSTGAGPEAADDVTLEGPTLVFRPGS
jgi:hypothetical protein